MIQRIQTVYLVVAALAFGAVFLLPDFQVQASGPAPAWVWPALWTAAGLCALIALVSVFLYKTRERQRTWVRAAQFLAAVVLVAMYVTLYLTGRMPSLQQPGGAAALSLLTWAIPLVGFALLTLARRRIQRDIDLVRSMDRLR